MCVGPRHTKCVCESVFSLSANPARLRLPQRSFGQVRKKLESPSIVDNFALTQNKTQLKTVRSWSRKPFWGARGDPKPDGVTLGADSCARSSVFLTLFLLRTKASKWRLLALAAGEVGRLTTTNSCMGLDVIEMKLNLYFNWLFMQIVLPTVCNEVSFINVHLLFDTIVHI